MAKDNANAADDIDLGSLAGALRRSLPKTLLVALIAGAGTTGVMMTMLPKYASQAVLQVVSTDPNTMSTEKYDPAAVATHVTALKSTDLMQRMSKEFRLAENPEFNNALPAPDLFTRVLRTIGLDKPKSGQSDEDRVLQAYFGSLKVGQGRETRAINLEFTSSDPAFSANAANRLAELYKESLTARTLETNDEEAKRLEPQVKRVREELAAAESQVAKFRADSDQFNVGIQAAPQAAQILGELTAELTKVSTARLEAESRARTAREQMNAGTAEANPDVQKSQLIPRLSEQRVRLERQVSELAATLMPAHPRMRQVQGDLAALNRQIKDETRKVVDGLERDAKIAKEREDGVVKRIDAAKRMSVTKAPQEAQLKALEEAAKNKRAELERIEKAFNEALSKGNAPSARVGVEIIQRAIANPEKVFPKPAFFGPLMALATLMIGLAWTVTREIVSGPRGSSGGSSGNDRIKLQSTEPAMSEPQPVAASARLTAAPTLDMPAVTAADTAQPLTVASAAKMLLDRTDGQPGFRMLVSGDSMVVDAAAEAVSIAKALSAGGKQVALVDWSAGASTLADLVGGTRGPGITELIQGDASFEDVIQRLADSEANFIPAGEPATDTAVLFDADRANLVLDALDEAYDFIVVYGAYDAARNLFQAVQGRFDTGISVSEARRGGVPIAAKGFLGFDVADMEIVRLERATPPPPRRSGPVRKPVAEAHA